MNILIVGAGLSGVVIARELAESGMNIRVIDKREHLGGNCYDEVVDKVLVHRYGPHIFHTSKESVVNWIHRYSEWIPYMHKVKVLLEDGRYATLPVNRETLAMIGDKESVLEIIFRRYTSKMWGGVSVSPKILNRVPIREDLNEYYFPDDTFQAMPKNGYTEFIAEVLRHPKIHLDLNSAFSYDLEKKYDFVFNSMPIDEYFNYVLGRLPYRSVKFHRFTIPFPRMLPVATVNFTHTGPYTRITEWKNFPNSGFDPWSTTITIEEPCDYSENNWEPYYPIKDLNGNNDQLYKKYKTMVSSKMKFIGRCGMYSYLDMDDAIDSSLHIVKEFIGKK